MEEPEEQLEVAAKKPRLRAPAAAVILTPRSKVGVPDVPCKRMPKATMEQAVPKPESSSSSSCGSSEQAKAAKAMSARGQPNHRPPLTLVRTRAAAAAIPAIPAVTAPVPDADAKPLVPQPPHRPPTKHEYEAGLAEFAAARAAARSRISRRLNTSSPPTPPTRRRCTTPLRAPIRTATPPTPPRAAMRKSPGSQATLADDDSDDLGHVEGDGG